MRLALKDIAFAINGRGIGQTRLKRRGNCEAGIGLLDGNTPCKGYVPQYERRKYNIKY